ncbi:hypothetical protein IDH41_16275 [Paenibacillus sp. IB182493]|uniref:N-terminal domain of peptidoglycan hydrolase CwlO-containing protein n=1 Tax=Paenibacillus arenilitoris TaxID=2772299 RepID=A0A927CM88_9BACL|nr:hypothetical protein [Paenibacillus arenilitoris]
MVRKAAALLLAVFVALQTPASAAPDPADDELHDLLEKSLSVVEIDKEIERIRKQQEQLTQEMADAERQLEQQEERIADKRDEAGSVLRAYYMGERDFLLAALISFDSLSDLLQMIDYAEFLFSHDKFTLDSYMEQYRKVKEGHERLETRKLELAAVESGLKLQRERVLDLERQLDEQLAGRSDADKLRLLMEELTSFWESAGIDEVKQYFQALSKAMQKLPEWVQSNKQLLEINGFQYTITVPEKEINAFLREQNDIFNNFSFEFSNGAVVARGQSDNMEIRISGHYTIENDPKNAILFHVDELLFNGFRLPDTTRQALEREFDLGFYPDLIVSFLKATSVEMKDDNLIIQLSLKL